MSVHAWYAGNLAWYEHLCRSWMKSKHSYCCLWSCNPFVSLIQKSVCLAQPKKFRFVCLFISLHVSFLEFDQTTKILNTQFWQMRNFDAEYAEYLEILFNTNLIQLWENRKRKSNKNMKFNRHTVTIQQCSNERHNFWISSPHNFSNIAYLFWSLSNIWRVSSKEKTYKKQIEFVIIKNHNWNFPPLSLQHYSTKKI